MSETVSLGQIKAEIRADIQDFVKKMTAVEQKLAGFGKQAKTVGTDAARLGGGFGDLAGGIAGAVLAFFSLSTAMKAFDMGRIGAQLKDASIVFKAAGNDIEEFRAKTKNLLSDQTLIQKFNFASQMGISKDTFTQLANIADAAAKKMGISQEYAFSSLITGTARGSKLILDNVGILYSAEKAYEDYARSIGKTVKQLTDFEQKMATQAAVLKAGNQMIKDVQGVGATVSDVYDQWDATMGNLTTSMGQFFDTVAKKYKIIDNLIIAGRDATDVFEKLGKSVAEGGLSKALSDAWGTDTGQAVRNYAAAFIETASFGHPTARLAANAIGGGPQDDKYWAQVEKAVDLTERAKQLENMIVDAQADIAARGFADSRDQNNVADLNRLLVKTNEELAKARKQLETPIKTPTEEELKKKFGGYNNKGEWQEGTWRPGLGDSSDLAIEKPSTAQIEGWEQERLRRREQRKEDAKKAQAKHEQAIDAWVKWKEQQMEILRDKLLAGVEKELARQINEEYDFKVTLAYTDSPDAYTQAGEESRKAEAAALAAEIDEALWRESKEGKKWIADEEAAAAARPRDLARGEALYGSAFGDPAAIGYAIGDRVFGGGSAQSWASVGGPLGAAMAPAIADAIGAVLEPLFDAMISALAIDPRVQSAGGEALGMVGSAGAGVGGAAASGLLAVVVALGGELTAATGGAALLVGAIAAVGAALYMLPPAMFMFMTTLGQGETTAQRLASAEEQTATTFERYQGAQALVFDRLIAAAQPFYDGLLWFVGLLDVAVGPLVALTANMAESDVLHRALFEATKMAAMGLLYLVGAASVLFEAFEFVAGAVMFLGDFVSLLASNGGNWQAALDEATERIQDSGALSWDGPTPSDINDALHELRELTFEEATARGNLIAGMYDEMQQRKKLNDELYNAPIGFKIAAFRFGAADAETPGIGSGFAGDATPVGESARGVQVVGDVNFIIENASDAENTAEEVANRLGLKDRLQSGQPPKGPWNPWR